MEWRPFFEGRNEEMNRSSFKIGAGLVLIILPFFTALSYPIAERSTVNSVIAWDPDEVFSSDGANHITIDRKGNVVLTGSTYARVFPRGTEANPKLNSKASVFLTKLSATGELVWSAVFGGSGNDHGTRVVVDSENNIIVTGTTRSPDFVALHAFDPTFNEGGANAIDAFVAKFAVNGSLLWSTFLGGTDLENGNSVAVDTSNHIIVVGTTYSADFPTKNAYQSVYGWRSDAFVSKFAPNGSMEWSTFLGGSDIDEGLGVATDPQNSIYVTAQQDRSPSLSKLAENGSLAWSLSMPSGAIYSQTLPSVVVDNETNIILTGTAENDVVVTKLNATGDLLWTADLGGEAEDKGVCLVVDSQNNVLVTGMTDSPEFPMKNAYDAVYSAAAPTGEAYDSNRQPEEGDAFIVKLASNGDLLWSTFLGGEKWDKGCGIAVDEQDNAYVTGFARSYTFPALNAYDASHNGYSDAFVSKFAANGSLIWSTYLGGDIYQGSEGSSFLEWSVGLLVLGLLPVTGFARKKKRSFHSR